MRYASITERLSGLGSAKWEVHLRAVKLRAEGRDILMMTIGEPDVETPDGLIETAKKALDAGRTKYSNGRGEAGLLDALSKRYTRSTGRVIGADQFLCLPGTQSSLYLALTGISQAGDEVLVGDPMYACYEGVVRASGAKIVAVPMRSENGFRMQAADIETCITPRSRAILLNTPHNPTGAILTADDIAEIGALAVKHDLWIISDEVYEEMVFDNATFTSPLAYEEFADRVIVVSSISKSHAAPGFRTGWAVGSPEFTARVLPVAETMLFGNQPFIADMTAHAVSEPSEVAKAMRGRFAKRAGMVFEALDGVAGLRVNKPQGGMFVLIDASASGLASNEYAHDLLENAGVAVMPGASFGASLKHWVRFALTKDDAVVKEACARIANHAHGLKGMVA
ncbi:MAG: pyridoxal phosphate-dependent aminotransferase [Amylibacter sp.]|nr:pyridoxal phosphate-dependent aminotransferase [Amylibacter sp.]